MALREATLTLTSNPDKVVISMTFAAMKSGQLVYYTTVSEETSGVDVSAATDILIEDAYTWYGITPP